jgi:hypothetical protein
MNYIQKEEEPQKFKMKKFIFTESQIKTIINKQISESVISEQPGTFVGDQRAAIDAGTRDFLTNVKHIKGVDLTDMINQYQKSIGMAPTGHMADCAGKLPPQDQKEWKARVQQNKPFYDKISDWLSYYLNFGSGSGY